MTGGAQKPAVSIFQKPRKVTMGAPRAPRMAREKRNHSVMTLEEMTCCFAEIIDIGESSESRRKYIIH